MDGCNPKSLWKNCLICEWRRCVTTDNLRIPDRAHVTLPYHIESVQEEAKVITRLTTIKELGQPIWTKQLKVGIRIMDLFE